MSERTQNPSQKSERRLAAQLAARKAAEAKRRRQAWAGGLAGVAVVALLITVFVIVGQGKDEPADKPASTASALDTRPEVKAGTGELTKLVVTPLIKGTGPVVTKGQTITTNYVGVFYADGKEFDSSWSRGEPASFPIGVGQVIPGWDQGLVGVTVGSRVQLDIPAELAYGNDASSGRPTGPLRFVVDILEAK